MKAGDRVRVIGPTEQHATVRKRRLGRVPAVIPASGQIGLEGEVKSVDPDGVYATVQLDDEWVGTVKNMDGTVLTQGWPKTRRFRLKDLEPAD